jgi:hypothetical protein
MVVNNMSLTYRGFDVVIRPGIGSTIVIKSRMEKGIVQSLLGGNYNSLFILNKYSVDFYSLENVKGDGELAFSIKDLRGYSGFCRADTDLGLEFEIPVSAGLIDCINEIRRKGRFLGLVITYWFSIAKLGYYEYISYEGNVEKILADGERSHIMVFYTEEIDDLMKKLGYAEFIRFEVPVPLIPETHIEIINRSAAELRNAEDKISKGDYPGALSTLRNIIMNYLTEITESEGEKKRILKRELRERVISGIPDNLKDIYKKILEGIEATLISNLEHIHKFIKEETGKMIVMPSREEAEYVYIMLISILRYISQLTITWDERASPSSLT